jgi:hypothetical protein
MRGLLPKIISSHPTPPPHPGTISAGVRCMNEVVLVAHATVLLSTLGGPHEPGSIKKLGGKGDLIVPDLF